MINVDVKGVMKDWKKNDGRKPYVRTIEVMTGVAFEAVTLTTLAAVLYYAIRYLGGW